MKRGQYVRLLLATSANPTKVIAAAKDMTLHLSAQTEESSTKDTTGDALEYEVTGMSYDISGSALVITDDDALGGNTANTLTTMLANIGDTELYWKIVTVTGANNRSKSEEMFSGKAKLTSLQVNADNRQNTTYSYTLNGQGAITVAQSVTPNPGS